jgi:hypothetical protein
VYIGPVVLTCGDHWRSASSSNLTKENPKYVTMIEESKSTPKNIRADINYIPVKGNVIQTKDWKPRYLGVRDEGTRTVTIHDVRGGEDRFDLDVNGFKFLKLPAKERSVESDEIIRGEYYPELEVVLKTL